MAFKQKNNPFKKKSSFKLDQPSVSDFQADPDAYADWQASGMSWDEWNAANQPQQPGGFSQFYANTGDNSDPTTQGMEFGVGWSNTGGFKPLIGKEGARKAMDWHNKAWREGSTGRKIGMVAGHLATAGLSIPILKGLFNKKK